MPKACSGASCRPSLSLGPLARQAWAQVRAGIGRYVLRSPLIHPPLLAALGAAGHGARVLIADANYSHSTKVYPGAALIHLNVRPAAAAATAPAGLLCHLPGG